MNVALILSGGIGTRVGADIPKQYIEICGKPVIAYCIEQLSKNADIDEIQIVAAEEWRESILKWLKISDINTKFKGFSKPGNNRQLSIYNGLKDISEYAADSDAVFIHDAARPLLSQQLISRCIDSLRGHDGVLPVLPMKDTVYLSHDGKSIASLCRREELYAGQAPEVFRLGSYIRANKTLLPDKILSINGSTEPAVMAGLDIVMTDGDENNFKITTKADLERFTDIVKAWEIL
jgi:2-C-methyl-D-erythritol 4-phosphate cytidylyltransferase